MRIALAYCAALVTLGVIDVVWLGVIARSFYRGQLGSLMADPIRVGPAVAFYLSYPAGIVLFAALPGADARSLQQAAMLGLAFGFFAYATYDLTNWATVRGWPAALSLVDIAWGSVLTGLAATAAAWVAMRV